MRKYFQTLIVAILVLLLSSVTTFAQKFWPINRVYAELSLHKSAAGLFNASKYGYDYTTVVNEPLPLLQPTGFCLALAAGNQTRQIKLRMLFVSDDIGLASDFEMAIMYGWRKELSRRFALDLNAGLSYTRFDFADYTNHNSIPPQHFEPQFLSKKTIGISTEANAQIMLDYVGLSPFVFLNFNPYGLSFGIGTKLIFGKPGYSKAQYSRLLAPQNK